ncbi:MAG: redoxin domain-containing protein [Chlorobi bacterium]|nr:redoxin domain-containing protein [Chlorobiota bacterium]MCI0716505.1 redoxin domain-containing protein [Chlorobiota bacterium]
MPRPVRLYDYKQDKILLIAFMPGVSNSNNYAKVMTTAFDTYFAEGLSFIRGYDYSTMPSNLKVLVVAQNSEPELNDYLRRLDLDFDMVSDMNLDISNFFGINKWNSETDGSFVYIINRGNKITYASYNYKGEGEKLKSVQKELFTLYNIDENSFQPEFEYEPIMPGDEARDFDFEFLYTGPPKASLKLTESGRLSDYFGKKNVLIAFYPAAFSYSCAAEVTQFDTYAEEKMLQNVVDNRLTETSDLEILMVSVSNFQILYKWNHEMELNNIKLVNDNTGEISMKYSSYNSLGYNKRTIFLIDKNGRVSYIDWDYNLDDEDFALITEHLSSIN